MPVQAAGEEGVTWIKTCCAVKSKHMLILNDLILIAISTNAKHTSTLAGAAYLVELRPMPREVTG